VENRVKINISREALSVLDVTTATELESEILCVSGQALRSKAQTGAKKL